MKKEEYMPGVNRINTYTDSRFSKKVLNQHGAFLIGDEPYEVEIVSKTDAIIRGKNPNFYESVIENFRFYAEHITNFSYGRIGKNFHGRNSAFTILCG